LLRRLLTLRAERRDRYSRHEDNRKRFLFQHRIASQRTRLLRQRIGPDLEFGDKVARALSAFGVPHDPVVVAGPEAASLPPAVWIVDAAVHGPRIETHRVRHAPGDEFLRTR